MTLRPLGHRGAALSLAILVVANGLARTGDDPAVKDTHSGLGPSLGDSQLHRRVSADHGLRSTGRRDRAPFGVAQIHTQKSGHGFAEDRVVRAFVQKAIARSGTRRAR